MANYIKGEWLIMRKRGYSSFAAIIGSNVGMATPRRKYRKGTTRS